MTFVLSNVFCWAGEKGKIRVSADREGAYIYVNGKKKAMTGEGYTSILLHEGEYEIKVEKKSDDGNWVYRGVKKVFVGEDTSTKIDIKTEKFPSEKQKKQIRNALRDLSNQFVRIKPGAFMMGSPVSEPDRSSDEKQHRVTLTKTFYMQKTEVTQAQWQAVMGENPSYFKDCGGNCPVEQVSWNDVQEFIKKLNRVTGKKYRLPTEAEWEYACRAGTSTPFSFGRCLSPNQANYNGEYPLKGCSKGKYRKKTVPVASFSPNGYGLYDMHGNVREWRQDWYGDYPTGSVTNPTGSGSSSYRVYRGGGWNSSAGYCRSAYRIRYSPGYGNDYLGFRLALSQGQ
ncbi:MAG: SUMF1/EgtB/PvdO family nonheme iron enzyme [Desulfobacteraceae bacterium]|nr:SUMF1/EgtB/PvdO family nonheme iron enzyme [Desulfobacteraceae bacterium]